MYVSRGVCVCMYVCMRGGGSEFVYMCGRIQVVSGEMDW